MAFFIFESLNHCLNFLNLAVFCLLTFFIVLYLTEESKLLSEPLLGEFVGFADLENLLDLKGGVELVEGGRVHHSNVGLDLGRGVVDHAQGVRLSPVLVGVLVDVANVAWHSAGKLLLEHFRGHVVEHLVLDDGELLDINLHYKKLK